MAPRPLVMVAIGAYWPGNEASGPNQSFRAMTEALHDRFRFLLLARDRPFGARQPLEPPGLMPFSETLYLPPGLTGIASAVRAVHQLRPALLWLNGFFDRDFTLPLLLAHRSGLLGEANLLISPRGEFNPGALSLKSKRKHAYIRLAKQTGLLKNVLLHATSVDECTAIRETLPAQTPLIAPNIRSLPALPPRPCADSGELRIAFVGRITPVKNLHFALEALARIGIPIMFDLYGPIEDEAYWRECLDLIGTLPQNIRVRHHGAVAHEAVTARLAEADLFFLPTLGENFGHAIFEALAAGTPALISDRTPWRNLATARAGWDIPLDTPQAFAEAITSFATLDETDRIGLREGARRLAEHHVLESDAASATATMLQIATERAG